MRYSDLGPLKRSININENQVFDFERYKPEILKYVAAKLNNEQSSIASPFYDLIVNRPQTGSSKSVGFDDQFEKSWKTYFSHPSFDTDGVWSQINLNQHLPRKSGQNATYNFYITVEKNRDNIAKFINGIPKIYTILKTLSDQKQAPISFKTHRLLDAFVSHNDSLKIFYYDLDLQHDIESSVAQWLQQTGIKTSTRTHTHGVDRKGSNGGSFGQILGNVVQQKLDQMISTHKSKFTPDQYFAWLKQYMPQIIQSVQIDKQ